MSSIQWFQVSSLPSSSLYMCTIAGLGFIMVVNTVGSSSLGYIFASMILILYVIFFTSHSQNPKRYLQKREEEGFSEENVECKYLEEVTESLAEQVADESQEGSGSMHRALNFSATVSEDESTGNNDNDEEDHGITSEDDVDGLDNYAARSSFSSEDDGSISDEDTLIEIELPTGHYLTPQKLNKKSSWMELLTEANSELATEEDNLIEIDILVGSIMCPWFGIEA